MNTRAEKNVSSGGAYLAGNYVVVAPARVGIHDNVWQTGPRPTKESECELLSEREREKERRGGGKKIRRRVYAEAALPSTHHAHDIILASWIFNQAPVEK
jgi:hypothetical protein